eukprot:CAMPEP_0198109550 /NCGR_PEP_ID=MMETSP1442-20131203/1632_1 /TAXON_ID= /ORGANISM="Craspedostauros australis, Strain CCMP3328" /LENGTH=114 /DNA_ID=CAMNT_0043765281 /DNA_START=135 /DNA_END=476 /DNA_ORIENTATION=-
MPNVTHRQLLDAAKEGYLSVLKKWKKHNKKSKKKRVDANKVIDWFGRTVLHEACIHGQLECIKYLIKSCGADINCEDNAGSTPLHYACMNGHLKCIEYLIKSCGANINCKDNNG